MKFSILISALLTSSVFAHAADFHKEVKRETVDAYGNVFKRSLEKRAAPGKPPARLSTIRC